MARHDDSRFNTPAPLVRIDIISDLLYNHQGIVFTALRLLIYKHTFPLPDRNIDRNIDRNSSDGKSDGLRFPFELVELVSWPYPASFSFELW